MLQETKGHPVSDTETKQIVGVCEEISEKNGWTAFAINVGSQYPVRLSTKLPALIEQGRAVGQQQAVWTFKESQGGENPNKPGTFYTNRYFDSVEVGGTVTQQAPAASSSGTPRNVATTDETRGSIERQTIVKAAIHLYPDGIVKSDAEFFGLLKRLEAFCAGAMTAAEATGPNQDDGIPF
jgi:hypothetical protein